MDIDSLNRFTTAKRQSGRKSNISNRVFMAILGRLKNHPMVILCGLILSITSVCGQTVDTFNPNISDSGAILAIAAQPDGKILLAGNFGTVGGLNRNSIARVNADGSLDSYFNPGVSGTLDALAIQADGKIIVGGSFTTIGGQFHTNLARLYPDGSVDSSFNANANSLVYTIVPQPDGRIFVGGAFTNLAGQACARIGRLNADGSLDANFLASANNAIMAITLQTNGHVLIGGAFTNLNGMPVNYIGRLNADGSLDATFTPNANTTVRAIMVQPDNLILVGGAFTNIAGTARNRIARLSVDGFLDASFNPGASNIVSSIALQANGKILVSGTFTQLAGTARNYIGRLNPNGTLDATFNPGANNFVNIITLQKDGKILVGGTFTNLAGGLRNSIGRLNNNDAAIESITNTASSIIWTRGGSSPEVWRTAFEISTNSIDWAYLGDGSRITGGWQLTGVSLPGNASLRMTGFNSVSGSLSGSSELIQSFWGAPFVVVQPASGDVLLKSNITINVVANGTTPLYYQWQQNGTNLSNGGKITGANTTALSITNVANTNAGLYSVVISNSNGSVTSQMASIAVANAVTNDAFNPALGPTYSTVLQADNKVIIGGNFVGTIIGGTTFSGIGRANSDGSMDNTFHPSANIVYSSLAQADGKVVIGGSFATIAGQPHLHFGRINADGTYDSSFSATANGTVYAVMAQPDGKLVVAGNFTVLGNQPHSYIGRINTDGSMDANFNPIANNVVYCAALQTNGQIIIGGSFTNLNGSVHNHIARLNSDGSLDTNFNASVDRYFTSDNPVYCLSIQPDGKILAGGSFFLVNGGMVKPWLMRLNYDGTVDTTFNANPNNPVYSLALQADGKIFIGGAFNLVNGVTQNYFARLNNDGTLDSTYAAGASSTVYSIMIQTDGRVLLGGNFGTVYDSSVYGYGRHGIGRFSNTKAVNQNLVYDGSTINWSRTGSLPEILWAAFDYSTDGVNWTTAGFGMRNATGWQLSGISIPVGAHLRGRGYVAGGEYCGSGWFTSLDIGQPIILSQPIGATNNAGTAASFGVIATGTAPLTYQWLKSGIPLTNSIYIQGSQSNILNLPSVTGDFDGGYSVVVSNMYGCITSMVSTLKVIDPFIYFQPGSQTNNAGTTVTLSVLVYGADPMAYQWSKNGTNLVDGDNVSGSYSQYSALKLQNVLHGDAGSYRVVVTNRYGSVTSSPAIFGVIEPYIVTQPTSLLTQPGQSASMNVGVAATPPLTYQWRKDGMGLAGATNATLTWNNLQWTNQGKYDAIISNQFGSITSSVASLTLSTVIPDSYPDANVNSGIRSLAIQADGKVLVGSVSSLGGVPINGLGRINTDGSIDTNFNAALTPGTIVSAVVIQSDNKIVMAGSTGNYSNLARIYPDGSVDTNYLAQMTGQAYCLALQPDGKILVGGYFNQLDKSPANNIGRINIDGSLDTTYSTATSEVFSIALQSDGKSILTGSFLSAGLGSPAPTNSYLARIWPSGLVDKSFNPSANGTVSSALVQPDGKILVAGSFSSLCNQAVYGLGRLNSDGSLDTNFNVTLDSYPDCLALQTDGKIIIGGGFYTVNGQPRNRVARLNADGTLDSHFNVGTDYSVYSIAIQPDGKILLGGYFRTVGGQPRNSLVRLQTIDSVTNNLLFDGTTLTWLRTGACPEVSWATFESSMDGTNWANLGTPSRISSGWQLGGVVLASNATIRARGYIPSIGGFNGSSWFDQKTLPVNLQAPPQIRLGASTFGFSTNAFNFSVTALIGQTIVIENSADLRSWLPFLTNTISSSPFFFSAPIQPTTQSEFYRVRLLQSDSSSGD